MAFIDLYSLARNPIPKPTSAIATNPNNTPDMYSTMNPDTLAAFNAASPGFSALDWISQYDPRNRTTFADMTNSLHSPNAMSALEFAMNSPWAEGILPALVSNLGLSRDYRMAANQQGNVFGLTADEIARMQAAASHGIIDENSPYFTNGTTITASGIGESKQWEDVFDAYYRSGMLAPFNEFLSAWNQVKGTNIGEKYLKSLPSTTTPGTTTGGTGTTATPGNTGQATTGTTHKSYAVPPPFRAQSNIGDYMGDPKARIVGGQGTNFPAGQTGMLSYRGNTNPNTGGGDTGSTQTGPFAGQSGSITPYNIMNSGATQGQNQTNLGLGDAAYNLGQAFNSSPAGQSGYLR